MAGPCPAPPCCTAELPVRDSRHQARRPLRLRHHKVCVGYRDGDDLYEHVPYHQSVLHRVQPVYRELPGWRADISQARSVSDLPRSGPRLPRRRRRATPGCRSAMRESAPAGNSTYARRVSRAMRHRLRCASRARERERHDPPLLDAEMSAVFAEETRLRLWLEIELLAVEAWSKLGVVPTTMPRPAAPRTAGRCRLRAACRGGRPSPTMTSLPSSTSCRSRSVDPRDHGSITA